MNMKTIKLFGVIFIGLMAILMVACEKDLGEDNDVLTGKWRDASIIYNSELLEEQPWLAKNYIEYAPYNSVRAKRTVSSVTYYSDTAFSKDKEGTYTIKGDSLIRVDISGNERIFKIITINKNEFSYKNSMNDTVVYIRFRN